MEIPKVTENEIKTGSCRICKNFKANKTCWLTKDTCAFFELDEDNALYKRYLREALHD